MKVVSPKRRERLMGPCLELYPSAKTLTEKNNFGRLTMFRACLTKSCLSFGGSLNVIPAILLLLNHRYNSNIQAKFHSIR